LFAGSAIVAPTGEIVAQAQGEDDEVIFCQADLALGDTFKQHIFNFAAHRRPEHYTLITERVGAGAALGKPPLL
jgi:predicted amidohydrolase